MPRLVRELVGEDGSCHSPTCAVPTTSTPRGDHFSLLSALALCRWSKKNQKTEWAGRVFRGKRETWCFSERETLCLWVVPSWGGAVPARPGGGALTVAAMGSAFLACGRGPHCVWNHIFLSCCVGRTDVRSRVAGVSWVRLGLRQPLHLSRLVLLICKTPVKIQNETKNIGEPCLKFFT